MTPKQRHIKITPKARKQIMVDSFVSDVMTFLANFNFAISLSRLK